MSFLNDSTSEAESPVSFPSFNLDNMESQQDIGIRSMLRELEAIPEPVEVENPNADIIPENLGYRSRAWVLTCNNYTNDHIKKLEQQYEKYGEYLIYGKEVAPRTGTPHLQCYIYFKNARFWRSLKNDLPGFWMQPARGTGVHNQRYCSKSGDFVEKGRCPSDRAEGSRRGGEANKRKWADTLDILKETLDPLGQLVRTTETGEEEVLSIDNQITVCHYRSLESIAKKMRPIPDDLQPGSITATWIFGQPGVGKSHKVRQLIKEANHTLYVKEAGTKWWPNYPVLGTVDVMIEDFDHQQADKFSHLLKIWTDIYAFPCEDKGGNLVIRPNHIYITSNYHPLDLFQGDDKLLKAIMRRLNIIEMHRPDDHVNWNVYEVHSNILVTRMPTAPRQRLQQ
jgi:hypothetical protein